ncbi:MAG: S8/S53 family peptidase [Myxococcota bacterium]
MRQSTLSLLSLFALAGCAAVQPAPSDVTEAHASLEAATAFSTTSAPYTKGTSSPFNRQVVLNRVIERVKSGEDCSDATTSANWAVSDLFPGTSAAELKRYCVLTWTGNSLPTNNSKPSGTLANMSHDRLAVVGLSGGASAVFSDLEDNTIDLVDPVNDFGGAFDDRARLTLIDSTPTSDTPMTESAFDKHGTRLAGLADAFVCDKQSGTDRVCAVDVESQLALGWEQHGTGANPLWQAPTNGGSVGRISDIATAIVDAVDNWKVDRDKTDSTVGRLVLNLSLGWHPSAYSITNKAAAENAVFAALNYASCEGVLVFAAAGHDDTPIGENGRMGASLPGAWEAERELTNFQCFF